MKTTKAQLKKIIPLYSDLTDLLLEFLEPCLDYDVAECTHKNTFFVSVEIYLNLKSI